MRGEGVEARENGYGDVCYQGYGRINEGDALKVIWRLLEGGKSRS